MSKDLTKAELERLGRTGERLYRDIKKTKRLPAGQFVAINCEAKSANHGKHVCAPLSSDAAVKFEKKFGSDVMWVRQIDFSVAQKRKNQRWPIGPM